MKNKAPLSRNLTKIKNLKNISMIIMDSEVKLAHFLLEIIDQKLSLDSLEQCSLRFISGLIPMGSQKFHEQKVSISKVLARVTYLASDNPAWYSFIISSGKLENLSVLQLKFASRDIQKDSKDILHFHNLSKLHKFTLDFKAHSLLSERNFLENFSLPPSLEDLSLNLTGFRFFLINENQAPYPQLFNRLQKAKRVKALNLKINGNSAETARFTCLLIKCFDSLETLNCSNIQKLSFFQEETSEEKPLDFQDFWTAITPSKETLQSISVSVNEIIFPEDLRALETGFPRLQKLQLKESVSSATELARLCQKIPSLTDVTLKGVKVTGEEKLKIFLDDMQGIPEGRNFELHLNVGNIKQGFLIDCLKKYIEDLKVKGRLGMYFEEVEVEDVQAFDEVSHMVNQKNCFEPFQMVAKIRGPSF